MPDKPKENEHTCFLCGAKSDQKVLLSAEKDGKPIRVCVRCLPQLVHPEP